MIFFIYLFIFINSSFIVLHLQTGLTNEIFDYAIFFYVDCDSRMINIFFLYVISDAQI